MDVQQPQWNRPLSFKRGSPLLLAGIDVFYDFDWEEVFGHDRSQFPRGKSLAELVYDDCPVGKYPTLLLTDQSDVRPSLEDTDERYIAIVPIRGYLCDSCGDPASTYYAHQSSTAMTRLPTLAEINFTQDQLDDFLDSNLTLEGLVAWAGGSAERLALLREASGSGDDACASTLEGAVAALRGLASLDTQVLDAVLDYLNRFEDRSGIEHLLRRLTASEDGRTTATGVLAERLSDRIADTRRRLAEYGKLIDSPDATETDVQRFLESSPWIVGLPYVGARPHVEIPRGEVDFVLDRFDGFFDIVELKGPSDVLIVEPRLAAGNRPASASSYSLGPKLAAALAQAHHYRALLDDGRDLSAQYGLGDPRQPRILIVLGRASIMSDTTREILRQLNLSLHRVEVIPYDELGHRTEGLLANIESLTGLRGTS